MDIRDIIGRKRDGGELSGEEVAWAVGEHLRGAVSDAQMAALLMAVALRGMSARETAELTLAMAASGERLDLSSTPRPTVDKHSTGGVGDKTTLIVAPLAAACGVCVPKMSGRALGHTGGTIDKLECIPGMSTDLSPERFVRQVGDIGLAIAAQTERMTPADKRLYALRDATGTVESIPLIASSVMSKKLAVGADGMVLDVKVGRGAFMCDAAEAGELARAMVEIGRRAGKRVVALVTRMDDPLGRAVGDAVEMVEAIQMLHGRGPGDLAELCEVLAGHMLAVGGAAADPEAGRVMARNALGDGRGLAKLREVVSAQGGDVGYVDEPERLLPGLSRLGVASESAGFVAGVDARRVGLAVRDLKAAAGEGRRLCGITFVRARGEAVARGEALAEVVAPEGAGSAALRQAGEEVAAAVEVADGAPETPPLVVDVIGP